MNVKQTLNNTTIKRDGLIILSIPLFLTCIFTFIPASIRELFKFQYHDPSIFTAWTTSLLHYDLLHLTGNIAWYIVLVGMVYGIHYGVNRHRQFWTIFASVIIITPFVTQFIDYTVFHIHLDVMAPDAASVGFSNVVSAFAGALVVSISIPITKRFNAGLGQATSYFTLVTGVLVFLLIRPNHWNLIILVVISYLLILVLWVISSSTRTLSTARTVFKSNKHLLLGTTYAAVIFTIHVIAGYPVQILDNGTFTNILAHASGLAFGAGLTAIVHLMFNRFPVLRSAE